MKEIKLKDISVDTFKAAAVSCGLHMVTNPAMLSIPGIRSVATHYANKDGITIRDDGSEEVACLIRTLTNTEPEKPSEEI